MVQKGKTLFEQASINWEHGKQLESCTAKCDSLGMICRPDEMEKIDSSAKIISRCNLFQW